jgi:hypothetical protein
MVINCECCGVIVVQVVFEDGAVVTVDSVIMCTGYTYSFPFLEEGLLEQRTNVSDKA